MGAGRSVHAMRRDRPGTVRRARNPNVVLERDLHLEIEREWKGWATESENRPLRATGPLAAGEKRGCTKNAYTGMWNGS